MLISCLLPTFNRYPQLGYLVEEAVYSFLQQDYPDKELILLNDTPGQTLAFDHPQVRVINASQRFPSLGAKLAWMIQQAQGDYLCRWDDDDISLPWRLRYSMAALMATYANEWRSETHWFWQGNGLKGRITQKTVHPGNTHIMSIWHRDILRGATYPGSPCPSGYEDQTFNGHLRKLGYPYYGDEIPDHAIFYLYRWGVSNVHLSGKGGGTTMDQTYAELGDRTIWKERFTIQPRWHNDYIADARRMVCALPSP
jgi:glycosyltransferase involved in cell wall biosynthesis